MIALAILIHCLCAGFPGLIFSLKGLGFGFSLFILPYLLGGIGAGDVKLMAAVGAALGVDHTLATFLFIAVLGGLVAVVMMSMRGALRVTFRNIGIMLYGFFSGAGLTALKVNRTILVGGGVPYGAVIALGTCCFFAWHWFFGQGLPVPQL